MQEKYSLSLLRSICRSSQDQALPREFEDMLSVIAKSFSLLDKAASFFYLFDFLKMRYLYVSEGIQNVTAGYTPKDWMQNGPEWVLSLVFDDDVRRLKDLHRALFDFYYTLPVEERKEYKYTWEYRFVRKDGQVVWLMQQAAFIEIDKEGKPMATFVTVSDITHLKKENSMSLTMFRNAESPSQTLYFPISDKQFFTKREIELIRLISEGLSSKQIAEQVGISPHTVDTHRRNMLKKCGVHDTIRLVAYARKNGLV